MSALSASAELAARLRQLGCVAPEEEASAMLATATTAREVEEFIARRAAGEPLAWIVGWTEFCGRRIIVQPGVFVPRWQSEFVARRAQRRLPAGGRAVDLCTGSGAIAALLGAVGIDSDPIAVSCARRNGVDGRLGDLYEPVDEMVDVIVAVPPYVPTTSVELLPEQARAFEPLAALDGGPDGLDVIRRIVEGAHAWLRAGGWLVTEIGSRQVAPTRALLLDNGFIDVAVIHDSDGDVCGIEAHSPSFSRK